MSGDQALHDSLNALRNFGAEPVEISSDPTKPEQKHDFEPGDLDAIKAALAAKRPLLVRGEPGVGKSQLAQAAAVVMKRMYLQHVVDSRTEPRDLLWREDAVARLADAQLIAALGKEAERGFQHEARRVRDRVRDVRSYIEPGVLWWAFDWTGAKKQAERLGRPAPEALGEADPSHGAVVLIDEIDKADAEVPNGLLEALGATRFTPLGWREPVRANGPAPLIVITTNNERALPDAFVRRCVTHELTLPEAYKDETKATELIERLVARGRAHFPETKVADTVLREAAKMLNTDRHAADQNRWRPRPGQAEYLDLVRAVVTSTEDILDDNERTEAQTNHLRKLRHFFFSKHVGATR